MVSQRHPSDKFHNIRISSIACQKLDLFWKKNEKDGVHYFQVQLR